MLAVQLHDAALVDARVLDVRDGIGCGLRLGRRTQSHLRRRWGVGATRLLPLAVFLRPAVQERGELLLVREWFKRLARRGGLRPEREQRQQRRDESDEKA